MAANTTTATHSEIIEALRNVVSTNKPNWRGEAEAFNVDLAADAILAGQVTPDTNDGQITDELEALTFGAWMSDGPWWQAATWTEEFVDGEWVQIGDYTSAPMPDSDADVADAARSVWETYIGRVWHHAGKPATYRVAWQTIDRRFQAAARIDVDADGHVEITGGVGN